MVNVRTTALTGLKRRLTIVFCLLLPPFATLRQPCGPSYAL